MRYGSIKGFVEHVLSFLQQPWKSKEPESSTKLYNTIKLPLDQSSYNSLAMYNSQKNPEDALNFLLVEDCHMREQFGFFHGRA